jgi:hypothetical protein
MSIEDIYTKGFVKLREEGALDLIRLDEFKLLNVEERSRDNGYLDVNPELTSRMTLFAQYLNQKYILPEWPEASYNKFLVWDGVDKDNQGWHTDMFEEYDIFFLYYFDDSHEKTGGSINFKWNTDDTASFQPKAGDLFMVSNKRGFWHRAESTKITRRVASFDFSTNS